MIARTLASAAVLALAASATAQVELDWAVYHDGPMSATDNLEHILIDDDGTLLVAGHETIAGNAHDLVLARYDTDGTLIWKQFIDGPTSGNDYTSGIAITPTGSIAITGYAYASSQPSPRYLIAQISSAGAVEWSESFGAPGTTGAVSADIAVDELGNVYVTGDSRYGGIGDMTLVKYDSTGDLQWYREHDVDGSYDSGHFVGLDGDGNVIMGGHGRIDGDDHFVIRRYRPDGVLLDSHTYAGPAGWVRALDMVVAPDGTVVFAGHSAYDIVVVAYHAIDGFQWAYTYDGGMDDQINAIAIDANGNVYATGESQHPVGGNDQVTLKLDPDGALLWSRFDFDDGEAWTSDYGYDIAFDADGNVHTSGRGERIVQPFNGDDGPETEDGMRVMSFTPDGADRGRLLTITDDWVGTIAVADDGRTYAVGTTWVEGEESNHVIYAYTPFLIDCNGNGISDPDEIAKGSALDCNGNGVPDECDMADGTSNDCDGDGVPDECQIADDPSLDLNLSGILDSCEAMGDLDGSGDTGTADLLILLSQWGCANNCSADVNGDGVVSVDDLIIMLAMWG